MSTEFTCEVLHNRGNVSAILFHLYKPVLLRPSG